jgi:hypothetical protein
MGDFIFGFILGRVIIGLVRLYFKLLWFLLRSAWWLAVFLILSAGAGMALLAKGGRARPDDTAGFGRFLDDTHWQDDATGSVYPAAAAEREYCEIYAADAGTYWRRTAISRLLRMGAIMRYRFDAITEAGPGRARELAASQEFPQEARHNITLDHVDPDLAGSDPYGLDQNRDLAVDALKTVELQLAGRGWEPAGQSQDQANRHWYANRYSRRVISWDTPIATDAPSGQLTGQTSEQANGQQTGQ